jgi:VIT1/CCC1 family predicted Fe2+/Mn2+ transporter
LSEDVAGQAPGQHTQRDQSRNLAALPGDRRAKQGDEISTVYQQLQEATGRRPGGPTGLLVAAVFILAVGLLILALLQGTNVHQLLILGIVLVVVNLFVALIWAAPTLPHDR